MFVQKNFDGVYHNGYTLDEVREAIGRQEREKEMLLLCPTGAFKSTANKIDAAQWMLNCPDVRIFIMTGSGALSRKFLKEVKGFFFKPEGMKATYFQALFPEYIIEGPDGETNAPMFCPARQRPQPGTPTLWVNSIDGAVAGWHCDVWKGDDIVNEDNSNTEDTRETLKSRYDNVSSNRPDKWAFKDHLGTRYFPDDWYGARIEAFKKYPDTNAMKFLVRAAWIVYPEYGDVPIKKLEEHMVDLYFPEFMPFKLLMQKCRSNEKQFRCQQLNEPAGGELACQFDAEAIAAHTIILNRVPRPADGSARKLVIIWDTAHTDTVQSDYSAGAVGYCHEATRALYVLEVAHGKWKDSECAVQLVDLHWKWNPLFSEVEKFHGWELFAQEVQRVSMTKYGKFLPLAWRATSNEPGAKRNKIKGLETLLYGDRLFFVDGDWMERLTQQFVRFTGFSKRRKDDIPEAIAGLQKLIPAVQAPPGNQTRESEAARLAREAQECRDLFARQQGEAEYRTIFQGPPTRPTPVAPEPAVPVDRGPERYFGKTRLHL
jgi:phage terminase large subunit-like protein